VTGLAVRRTQYPMFWHGVSAETENPGGRSRASLVPRFGRPYVTTPEALDRWHILVIMPLPLFDGEAVHQLLDSCLPPGVMRNR